MKHLNTFDFSILLLIKYEYIYIVDIRRTVGGVVIRIFINSSSLAVGVIMLISLIPFFCSFDFGKRHATTIATSCK